MTHKKTHGGARPGAGRPKAEDPTSRITVTITQSQLAALDHLAAASKQTRSAALRQLLHAAIK